MNQHDEPWVAREMPASPVRPRVGIVLEVFLLGTVTGAVNLLIILAILGVI